jgi:adenylate cyclase
VGPVTLARVGVKSVNSDYNSLVAIGTTTNVACKLMKLIPNGGICIGEHSFKNLPNNWSFSCTPCSQPTNFFYVLTKHPYPAWELNYRLSDPKN